MDWGFFFWGRVISAVFTFIVKSIGSINMDWGSFWGSVIGAVTTFIAFLFTYRLSKNQNEKTQQQIKDQLRMAIQPLIAIDDVQAAWVEGVRMVTLSYEDLQLSAEGISQKQMERKNYCAVYIINVGQAVAANLCVAFPGDNKMEMGHVDKGKKEILNFSCPFSKSSYDFSINCEYSNINGKKYKQTMEVSCRPDLSSQAAGLMCIEVATPSFPEQV